MRGSYLVQTWYYSYTIGVTLLRQVIAQQGDRFAATPDVDVVMPTVVHPEVDQLRIISFFADYSTAQLEQIARIALLVQKKQHEPVLTHGGVVIGLYLLMRGTAAVFLPQAKQAAFQLEAPTFFGELAYIDAKPASATVRVASPELEFMVVPRERLLELCNNDPSIGMPLYRNLAMILAERLREANLAMSRIL